MDEPRGLVTIEMSSGRRVHLPEMTDPELQKILKPENAPWVELHDIEGRYVNLNIAHVACVDVTRITPATG